MGAPTQNPPQFVIDALKKALETDGVHTYSNPRGEKFYTEAIAKRIIEDVKKNTGVELDNRSDYSFFILSIF